MGGHVACRLIETHPKLKGVILQSAAAYAKEAENLPLNDQFTQAISQENSWINSPTFTALESFPGKILVVYGDQDKLVPQGVQSRYQAISHQKGGQVLLLKNCPHALLKPHTPVQQAGFNRLLQTGHQFITSI